MPAKKTAKKKAKAKSAPASKRGVSTVRFSDYTDPATYALLLEAASAARAEYLRERMWEKKHREEEAAKRARTRATKVLFRKVLPGLLAKEGMSVDHVEPHMLRIADRKYDFIARSDRANFVGEVKVRFRVKDLWLLRQLLAKFREDCPELAGDRPTYGVVCGTTITEEAVNIARDEGFLVAEGQTNAKLHLPPQIRSH